MTKLHRIIKIGFIGGGNMAEALVNGLLSAGKATADIQVAEPLASRRRALKRSYGVEVGSDNRAVAAAADLLVLAVKPQVMPTVLTGLRGAAGGRTVVVSIAAGIPLSDLEHGLGVGVRVVRVMPNTPALVGRGAAVLCGGTVATRTDVRDAALLFETVGRAFRVEDEKQLDAVTGLSGSGPAYVYAFAEALIKGGTDCGLEPGLAADLVFETIAGAAEMMVSTGRDPADLREAVSSPGGTTLAGLARLRKGRFASTVADSVKAAARRSRELGRGK